ncbi:MULTISPECIES: hypothetical protein [unclassified Pseudomonas]|uniref:hypothetical protein n=1 Tax=unclassified Pseudomonas TaxID=196821 RepID=UPI002AC90938|nr:MULTISPECIES: hypothetical protein [unclassified Pseudomonas]MEB0041322.1 hypothetical protein [Pseudomonas sp. MH10]MEB0076274.1 hypothetical protein [Pseudomonas sp. MH10out]MEB0090768.1 hypothetical protein [Pseudomonas sp. CCI4.2]MEB0100553.1 hypothetical protein [Pseudomonas sp. CCI3.2]MEB0121389.1 hypothetical protein [Pseudomonas sp. CCI1.2]
MDMPCRTFSDVYRGQVIDVLVVCPPGVLDTVDFIVQVTVTLNHQAASPAINVCGRGYESYDEAHHAGILIGQGMIDSLTH